MAATRDGLDRLRTVARRLRWGGLAGLVLSALTWLGWALYDGLAPAGAGAVAGPLLGAAVILLAPLGLVLLVLGLAAGGCAWWLGRRRPEG